MHQRKCSSPAAIPSRSDRPGSALVDWTATRASLPSSTRISNSLGFTIDQRLNAKQSVHYSQWRNSYSNFSFDSTTTSREISWLLQSAEQHEYEPALGSGFLLTYDNAITQNLVMTAGFGWIGEINNQFNQTKYSSGAVQTGVIPPTSRLMVNMPRPISEPMERGCSLSIANWASRL